MYSLIFFEKGYYTDKRKEWRLNKKSHRKKGPAIEYYKGIKIWAINGLLHRSGNLPAVECPSENNEYWEDGQRYLIQENGTKEFYNGFLELSRFDKPAIEYANGDEEWWNRGERHRKDGPAVIYGNKQFWFEFGEFIKCTIS